MSMKGRMYMHKTKAGLKQLFVAKYNVFAGIRIR
jgi:hypothetical protein